MILSSLPDIAGMIILMGVLNWLRCKYRESSFDLWMLGLLFILMEAISVAVLRNSPSWSHAAHAMALDAYVAAGVTFGWASREDLIPGEIHLPLFLLPAVPLFAMTTLYGWGITSTTAYLVLVSASLVLGVGYSVLLLPGDWKFRTQLLAIHLLIWLPMIWMAKTAQLRLLVYWGLTCLYLMIAASFRKRIQRGRIGGLVVVTGFTIWAFCFLAHPFVRSVPLLFDIDEQLWTMQKFFVIIGMVLVLLEEQTRRLEQEAMHDPLTGLPNRRLFDDRLLQAISRSSRTQLSAAVFIIDLDNFKIINDTLGHRAGDLVLARVGTMLRSKIRSSDTLARCGGDEFNVIVNDLARPSDCERIAETLRAAVASVELPPDARTVLTASIGYAICPDEVLDPTELCELADIRMYRDKRMSRSALSKMGFITTQLLPPTGSV
jgi:diguanylate cyclase (GGDEF)-like protein